MLDFIMCNQCTRLFRTENLLWNHIKVDYLPCCGFYFYVFAFRDLYKSKAIKKIGTLWIMMLLKTDWWIERNVSSCLQVKHQRRTYRRTIISPPKRSAAPPSMGSAAAPAGVGRPRGNLAHLEPGELTFSTLPFVGKYLFHIKRYRYVMILLLLHKAGQILNWCYQCSSSEINIRILKVNIRNSGPGSLRILCVSWWICAFGNKSFRKDFHVSVNIFNMKIWIQIWILENKNCADPSEWESRTLIIAIKIEYFFYSFSWNGFRRWGERGKQRWPLRDLRHSRSLCGKIYVNLDHFVAVLRIRRDP